MALLTGTNILITNNGEPFMYNAACLKLLYYIIICIINLSDAVMLDGAYDKGKAPPADP